MSAGAVGALAAGISDVLRGLGWARSKDNPNGKWWTSTPDDYYDHALPALVKAGYPMAGHTLNLMMRLSWGNKGKRGEPGPEWIPMPVKELTERLGSNRNTISNNLRALVAAGVLEARDNAKDKRNKEYRVAVENLSKLNAKAFRETYEALSAESLSDVRQDDEADDAAVAMDAASAAAPAFDGPVVRFGARRISAIQVAQEAHLCKTCTHHFIEYAEAAAAPAPATKSAEVTTTEVKNVSAANTAVAAKQCKPNVHNSPDLPPAKRPSESSLIPQLRTELSHRFAARLASPPTDSLLRQIAAKLEDAGADVPFFLTRCDQRERQVKTWGFLWGLADDAAGAARMFHAARRERSPSPACSAVGGHAVGGHAVRRPATRRTRSPAPPRRGALSLPSLSFLSPLSFPLLLSNGNPCHVP